MNSSYSFLKDPEPVIQRLKAILTDEYCGQRMNMGTVTGFLGELLVGRLLQNAGYPVEHFGKQHGFDLRVPSLANLTIDVKTSLKKSELGCNHWGWALVSGSKNKPLSFTHIVCVALDEAHDWTTLLVIAQPDVLRFPGGIRPFVKNKHILLRLAPGEALPTRARPDQLHAVTTCQNLEEAGAVRVASTPSELVTLLTSSTALAAPQGAVAPDGSEEPRNVLITQGIP